MVLESWVVILILGIAAYMFVRSKRKVWAMGVLPLMLVPFVNIIYSPINRHIVAAGMGTGDTLRILIYVAAFLASSAWVIA